MESKAGREWREEKWGGEESEQWRCQGVSQVCHHLATMCVCPSVSVWSLCLQGHTHILYSHTHTHTHFHRLSRPLEATMIADCQTEMIQTDWITTQRVCQLERPGAWLTNATAMRKARGSVQSGRDPVLGSGNLGLKGVKRGGSGRTGWRRIREQTRRKDGKGGKEEEERGGEKVVATNILVSFTLIDSSHKQILNSAWPACLSAFICPPFTFFFHYFIKKLACKPLCQTSNLNNTGSSFLQINAGLERGEGALSCDPKNTRIQFGCTLARCMSHVKKWFDKVTDPVFLRINTQNWEKPRKTF